LITLDCGSDGTLCTSKTGKGEILRNRPEEHNLRHSNAELMIGMVKDETDESIRDEGYSKYAFNDLISRRIGNHRTIPDTRHERYGKNMHLYQALKYLLQGRLTKCPVTLSLGRTYVR
jgi:hypothetical protein